MSVKNDFEKLVSVLNKYSKNHEHIVTEHTEDGPVRIVNTRTKLLANPLLESLDALSTFAHNSEFDDDVIADLDILIQTIRIYWYQKRNEDD